MRQDMNKMKAQVKEYINTLVSSGNIEQAKVLINEYREIVIEDIEIYSVDAVIAIMEGDLLRAENILKDGLEKDCNNFDLKYNLAYIYEQKGLYLKALETYEDIIFNMGDIEQRQHIIEYLNRFEVEHREVIQKELEERQGSIDETIVNGKKRYLHLMYDSPYCEKIISLVNSNFSSDEHQFVIFGKRNLDLSYIEIKNIHNAEILDLEYDLNILADYIENCSKILIQYLFDVWCEVICRLKVDKPIYWFLWGGDLYNYIDFDMHDSMTGKFLKQIGFGISSTVNKNSINYIFRKAAIRKIDKVGISFKEDFKSLKKNFITAGECIDYVFPNPVDYKKLNVFSKENKYEDLKRKFKNVLLVGNSSNPSNNHIDILYQLEKIKNQSFCIIMPLSYGGDVVYVNEIVKLGKNLFGDRFIPLLEYMNSIEYGKLLSIVDSAIMSHNRPQAAGNINALIYLGKKVFMAEQSSFYLHLKEIGVEIFNVSDVKSFESLFSIDKNIQEVNKMKIFERFGNAAAIEAMSRFFD